MNRILLAAAIGLPVVSMGVTRHAGLEGRLATLEESASRPETPTVAPGEIEELRARLDELLREAAMEGASVASLEGEVDALEAALADARAEVLRQRDRVAELSGLAAKAERIDEVEAGAKTRWDGLVRALDATTQVALETRDELGLVRAKIGTDVSTQWNAMVGPTVQLAGDTTVGSGVLLPSRPIEDLPGAFQTLLLTSYHVVRDIRADSRDKDAPVPVILRAEDGTKREFTARLLDHDVGLDAALLALNTNERLEVGAHLPTRERLAAARVFDDIVAVGCPLGNDPIPTRGHLSDLHHRVGDERFWMISAPTYIGNSGGGLFSAGSHELVGIFSKIYTHGAIRPTVIPHMGLVTPLEEFYDWIDEGDVARVLEQDGGVAIVLR